jgi:toxin ParE1/3/4
MRLIWTARAIADLAEIRAFVGRDDARAAAATAARITQAVTRLVDHPGLGRSGREAGTRELVISRTRYIVPYRVESDSIVLLAVIQGARRWPRL